MLKKICYIIISKIVAFIKYLNLDQVTFDKFIFCIGINQIILSRKNYKKFQTLHEAELKIHSQNGEDGIIDYLAHQLSIPSPNFVEMGVGNYRESNTRFLFERTACRGLIIDCLNNLEAKVSKNIKLWKGDLTIVESFINSKNVLDILNNSNFNQDVDFFSIDIDGTDYWVLEKLPNSFSKIVVLEYNAVFGPELEVTVPNIEKFNRTDYHYSNLCFGASLKALINLMMKKNFVFVGTNLTLCNAFFVSKEYINQININIPDINDLSNYTNSFIRESRSIKGFKNYLSDKNRIKEIENCEVINIKKNNELIRLKELL